MNDAVVTRFAPSPTGFLHIGGARTALFNWLYARHFGGTMLLRIEDTDRERSTDAAIKAILDGLNWLGLHQDGEVIYQFDRAARHREAAETLLAQGRAYKCFATAEDLALMREQARARQEHFRYDGRWRDRPAAEVAAAEASGQKAAIRLKAPQTGETVIADAVQGRVAFPNKDLDDLVLLRSDGNPTYMLAVVVDDHDMGVTHIIRGDDHLTNAARQTQIYDAFGWTAPAMSHIPLIHGPDGAKLSKRHGALGVDAYREMGYLPEALRNYLVRLGWSHGDQEFFTTTEMIEAFDLRHVGRSAARFDFDKLKNLNGHYIRVMTDQEILRRVEETLPFLPQAAELSPQLDDELRAKFLAAMPGLKERAKTLIEIIESGRFLFAQRPLPLDAKASEILSAEAKTHIAALLPRLAALKEWTSHEAEAVVRVYAEEIGAKLGQIAQPLRAALTGKSTSPGIFDVLQVLGRRESLARLADQAG